ncbi:hypothetical protein A2130_03930 [Candidatus Woesebacteria bacterium GWC2_33_12]|uniref:POTRA domain-containing protein n=1 Tax=Candidatus Woesebacteria bacterium GW2011_GWB1_33_22 TaxID=1618566 RepID=A0A0G0CQ95_9BACT|nr:MAG: hypothetical protein UR29_C0001G0107 [Candidatus Woesebacteria bacterium GW2011_GWC2_33_12]KKP42683.1 MAG: hypothetical protein UR33_C0001G0044 [Candidatus Woesebacteria bacterium GW2011_GWA2_33_20]KKP45542.1 MAG: hypothetical protein UR35_C0001G0139 [Candidatus Woesebacteria bacterium GW2011_GWB1_33_22]KKP47414.1 MAG: hypothetical protein UR37_C0001G0107 [Microgenomates group bacterium GW2011_GWC1_33_28]KKP51160.1 MAG: hypothetical protein UR41_C0001G0107 [Candidatus Woesebacteria bact
MRKKTKKLNIFKILSILLVIIFLMFIPLIIQKSIKIQKIECKTQYGDCEGLGDRLQVIGNYKDVKNQIEQELNKNIQINNYLIQYKIPDILKIELNLKKPKYAIFDSQKYYLLDKNGLILSDTNETNLPTLVVKNYQNKIGSNISDKELFSLKIIEKTAWLYSVKVGFLENNELKITLKEGVLVHFPLEGDIDTLVGSLRLVFSRLNDGSQGIKMSDIDEIDLRFKSVILR